MENMSTNKDINNEKISSKNNHVNFRSLLYEIIEDGNFPDGSFDCKHLERIYNVKWVDADKVRFSIERHPHLFGHKSEGMTSSAFARQVHNFELDVNTKQVKELGTEIESCKINYDLLAEEVVPNTFEGWLHSEQREELVKLEREKEVINFAKQGFKEIDWLAPYYSGIEEYNVSNSDVNKLLTAFEDAFINKVLEEWKDLKSEGEK